MLFFVKKRKPRPILDNIVGSISKQQNFLQSPCTAGMSSFACGTSSETDTFSLVIAVGLVDEFNGCDGVIVIYVDGR